MMLIVGLGNPGREYAYTRHNVGFLVLDTLAAHQNIQFQPSTGEYWSASFLSGEEHVTLLKPTTFMNNSGVAVQQFVDRQNIPIERIFVVCDDFQLPLGTLRLRASGSDGGHNGLASVIYHLQSDLFGRLRCGIGSAEMPADKSDKADFVLSQFTKQEFTLVSAMIQRAADASMSMVTDGITAAMNRFNTRIREPEV
jgi:PTH1 family peptidyl-tRNA hydrolase